MISGLLGFFLIGWSFLRYETEEAVVEDILATWWIRLDDTSTTAVSWTVQFIRKIGSTLTEWIDRAFGERLLSVNAITTSICLSLSSLFLFMGGSFMFEERIPHAWVGTIVMLLPSIALFHM